MHPAPPSTLARITCREGDQGNVCKASVFKRGAGSNGGRGRQKAVAKQVSEAQTEVEQAKAELRMEEVKTAAKLANTAAMRASEANAKLTEEAKHAHALKMAQERTYRVGTQEPWALLSEGNKINEACSCKTITL